MCKEDSDTERERERERERVREGERDSATMDRSTLLFAVSEKKKNSSRECDLLFVLIGSSFIHTRTISLHLSYPQSRLHL